MGNDWRQTLFVWDGILSFIEKDDKENEDDTDQAESGSNRDAAKGEEVKWVGTWVGCNYADATKVPTPKRGAFDEFVSSENKFVVEGTTTWGLPDDDKDKDNDAKKAGGDAPSLYRVTMTGGSGYDLGDGKDKKKHKDDRHDVYFSSPTLRWTGNLRDQIQNMVLAVGENEFGNFISVGWLRVGNRVTLARRYLDEGDERAKWDIDELRKVLFDQIIATENGDDQVKVVIPPWQCATMHANPGQLFKRQKISNE